MSIHNPNSDTEIVGPLPVPVDVVASIPLPVTTSGGGGVVDANNSAETTLLATATWTGVATNVSAYPSVVLAVKSTQSGTAYMEFSTDGVTWQSSLSFTIDANTNEVHRLSVTRMFYRTRVVNGAVGCTISIQTLLGAQPALTSALNSTVQSDADSLVTRSVLMGQMEGGVFKFVPVTTEGHIEVAVHSPRLPFGSIHTESLTPVFQGDAVYQLNPQIVQATTSGTGSATASNSEFICATGVGVGAFGTIQSRKRLRYRAGQGVVGRMTAKFSTPVALSILVAGFGHAEDGVYFGYNGTSFGILYVNRGVREQQTLTITTGATAGGNVTVTLNGTPFVIAVTNVGAGNQFKTAWEIAQTTFAGWTCQQVGATVLFLANSSGDKAGAFSFAAGGTGSAGAFAETKAGVASTDLWIPQSTWNGDVMDGSGSTSNPSGVLLNPQKGNVYQVGIQYLGYGAITFQIETATAGNNPDFVNVHTILYPNTNTLTSFGNPSFPFTMASYSAGSASNVTTSVGSFAGFIEGKKVLNGPRQTYIASSTAVDAAAYYSLEAIKNSLVFSGRSNQAVINLMSISAALKHNFPCTIYLIKNPTFITQQNFSSYSTSSCSLASTTFSAVTFSDNSQILWTGQLGDTGNLDFHFGEGGELTTEELTLQPGETVALCARTNSGTASYVSLSLNTREDQ